MKKLLYLLSMLLLFYSCDTATDKDPSDEDSAPYVTLSLPDFSVEEGTESKSFDLNNIFFDEEGDALTFAIVSNTNEALVQVSISGNNLQISFTAGSTGVATIVYSATANEKTAQDNVTITVTENGASVALTSGNTFLQSGNYADAITSYTAAIANGDSRFIEEAHLGLGFAEIKTYSHSAAFSHLTSGANLSGSEFQNDFDALLVLLNYSLNSSYSTVISNGLSFLNSNNTFSMHFDSSIDEKDIRVTVAMAYYQSNDFTNALAQAKLLDSTITLQESDDNFQYKLADELNRLVNVYK